MTKIAPLSDAAIAAALLREQRRHGQSFLICPRIQDLEPHLQQTQQRLAAQQNAPQRAQLGLAETQQQVHDPQIRLQELEGRAADSVEVSIAAPVISAREVTGDEQPRGDATVTDGKLTLKMTAYQPRTFALTLAPLPNPVSPPSYVPVELPYNTDVLSSDGPMTAVFIYEVILLLGAGAFISR